jgi:isoleucyl-tRNA synthetase
LASWPTVEASLVDRGLANHMRLVRRLVELGRAARASASVRTRQPLSRALVAASGWQDVPVELRQQLADELNVAEVVTMADQAEELITYTVKPNFRSLGKQFGNRTKAVAAAVTGADPVGLVRALRETGRASVDVDGERVTLDAEQLIVTESPRADWAVASAAGETVALDLHLTTQLRRAGLLREAVRLVQEARKGAGLEVVDRIELWWQSSEEELAAALRDGGDLLGAEVLAPQVVEGHPNADLPPHRDPELGLTFWFRAVGG